MTNQFLISHLLSRQSVAFFIHPDDETIPAPVDGRETEGKISARQHVLNRFSETYVV